MTAQSAMTIEEYEQLTPVTTVRLGGGILRFVTPNRRTAWRVQTLLTKEPTTIEWLDTIEPGETLLDVGANMGLYTIYAAILRQARVDAIEPESQNFALLCSNIVLNRLTERAAAWPMALSDVLRFDKLHLSDFGAGGSCHSFGESVNFKLEPQTFPFTQGCVAGTIDDLIEGGALRMPNHIKIDVDGIEHKVISGALRTLENPALRSLIIETNPALAEHRQMISLLRQFGFALDPTQIARATRADGPFKGVAEHVFRR